MHSLLVALLLAARPFTPEELLATRRADDVQVSPDGKWASATVRQKNLETNKDDKDIWLLPVGAVRRASSRGTRAASTRAGRPTASSSSSSARVSSGCTTWPAATGARSPG